MFFFNLLFFLSGLILIIIGAVAIKFADHFGELSDQFSKAPLPIIVVGAIVLVVGFLGCCGAVKENYCMVCTFAVLLSLIFIIEIVAGVLGVVWKNKVKGITEEQVQKEVKNYNENGKSLVLDMVQQELECCGRVGAADYDTHNSSSSVFCGAGKGVASCHVGSKCNGTLYNEGCQSKLVKAVKANMLLIGGAGLGIAFIQLLGIVFACLLMKAIKGEYEAV